ncbi:MAG: hypothetical protein JOZ86_00740 [Candidatus Eremiobacteraeota bacterium]|nr:hypothetical protein [Candidatus Eremiobacteraeota bacterium]
MARMILIAAGILIVGWLGAIQLASSAAYGDLAVRPSLPALLHDVAPKLLRPFLGGTAARAAAALHNGDLTTAGELIATLPDDAPSADLRGQLAEARGDRDAAVRNYVHASDVIRAQALIEAVAVADPARALADQQRLVAGLRDDPSAAEVTGEAWWRLGQLQAAAAYRESNPGRRAAYDRAAEASYERALTLAPNEETYLLAAGYQSLKLGALAAATRWYTHAVEVVPNSADAFGGLAWSAALRGDCAGARTYLARSRARRAASGATSRDPAADPLAGPALKRCTT